MKKISLILFTLLCAFTMTACSSNIEKKNTTYSELEYQNIFNDYTLYFNETCSLYSAMKNNEFTEKSFTIFLAQSLENYYSIASNRLTEDIEDMSSYSDSYIDYLGYNQAYVNLYLDEADTIKKAMKEGNIDTILNTKFYQQTMTVADSSIQFVSDLQDDSKEKS